VTLPIQEEQISWTRESGELGSYSSFLEKEIFEQPAVLRNLARPERMKEYAEIMRGFSTQRRVWLVGCGSAAPGAILGERLFREAGFRFVEAMAAHEFVDLGDVLDREDAVIALSQSGETIDVLDAVRFAASYGCETFGIVNVPGSTLTREVDRWIP